MLEGSRSGRAASISSSPGRTGPPQPDPPDKRLWAGLLVSIWENRQRQQQNFPALLCPLPWWRSRHLHGPSSPITTPSVPTSLGSPQDFPVLCPSLSCGASKVAARGGEGSPCLFSVLSGPRSLSSILLPSPKSRWIPSPGGCTQTWLDEFMDEAVDGPPGAHLQCSFVDVW